FVGRILLIGAVSTRINAPGRRSVMTAKRIVATAPIGRTAIEILEQIAPVIISAPDDSSLLALTENTVGLIVRGEGRATKQVIDACPELRVIGRPGAGYDSVDIAAASAR